MILIKQAFFLLLFFSLLSFFFIKKKDNKEKKRSKGSITAFWEIFDPYISYIKFGIQRSAKEKNFLLRK